MNSIQSFIETFFVFCLFLMTDIRAYGYNKKRRLPAAVSVILSSFVLTCINTVINMFLNDWSQPYPYIIYIALLFAAGLLYTVYFIDVPIVYSISLQLELICCCSMFKTLWIILCDATIGPPYSTAQSMFIYYSLLVLSLIGCSYFFSIYTLRAPYEQPYKYYITITLIPLVLFIEGNLVLVQNTVSRALYFTMNFIVIFMLLATHYLSYLHISSYNELVETKTINQRMVLQQNQIERSSALVDQISRDKHEMKNVYFYLNTLLESKQYDELSKFISTKLLHRYDHLEEFHTGCQIIDYLLSQKACEAKEAGISFFADIQLPDQLCQEYIDLCSILQNLLDNAIDASSNEAVKDIHIKMGEHKGYLEITVKNRCSTNILEANPRLLTTKSDKISHGIGTRVIRHIVNKYDGILDYSMESGYFTARVLLMNRS